MIKHFFYFSLMIALFGVGVMIGNYWVPNDTVSDMIGTVYNFFGGRIEFDNVSKVDNFLYGTEYLNRNLEKKDLKKEKYHFSYKDASGKIDNYFVDFGEGPEMYQYVYDKDTILEKIGYWDFGENFYYFNKQNEKIDTINMAENKKFKNEILSTFSYSAGISKIEDNLATLDPVSGKKIGTIQQYLGNSKVNNDSKDVFNFTVFVGFNKTTHRATNKIEGKLNLKKKFNETKLYNDLSGTALCAYSISEWLELDSSLPQDIKKCIENI